VAQTAAAESSVALGEILAQQNPLRLTQQPRMPGAVSLLQSVAHLEIEPASLMVIFQDVQVDVSEAPLDGHAFAGQQQLPSHSLTATLLLHSQIRHIGILAVRVRPGMDGAQRHFHRADDRRLDLGRAFGRDIDSHKADVMRRGNPEPVPQVFINAHAQQWINPLHQTLARVKAIGEDLSKEDQILGLGSTDEQAVRTGMRSGKIWLAWGCGRKAGVHN